MLSFLVVGPVTRVAHWETHPSRLRGERVSWESGGGVHHPFRAVSMEEELSCTLRRDVEVSVTGGRRDLSIDETMFLGSGHSMNFRFLVSLLIGLVMPCQKLYSILCCRLWRSVLRSCCFASFLQIGCLQVRHSNKPVLFLQSLAETFLHEELGLLLDIFTIGFRDKVRLVHEVACILAEVSSLELPPHLVDPPASLLPDTPARIYADFFRPVIPSKRACC